MFFCTFRIEYGITSTRKRQIFSRQATRKRSPFPGRNMKKLQAQSKRVSELESYVELLMEALRLARNKRFGASSEKSDDTLTEQLSFLFNEAEVFAVP